MISSVCVGELQKKTSLFRSAHHPFVVRDGRKNNLPLSLVIPISSEKDIIDFLASYRAPSLRPNRAFISEPGLIPTVVVENILSSDDELESLFYHSPLLSDPT